MAYPQVTVAVSRFIKAMNSWMGMVGTTMANWTNPVGCVELRWATELRMGFEVRTLLANSEYLAELCAGQACEDPSNPILDFDKARRCETGRLSMVSQWLINDLSMVYQWLSTG